MFDKGLNILTIDLSTKTIQKSKLDDERVLKKYLAGRGIATYLMLTENDPNYDPYDDKAPIYIAIGLLNGTNVPSSGRVSVLFKSPVTQRIFKTNSGGSVGAQLAFAGYDILKIVGRSSKPVYIYINDDEIEIREASHLWGKDTRETTKTLLKELGDDETEVLCIGPAGENKVVFSSINMSIHNVAARGGGGAVLGHKNLKAITVRGTKSIKVAQPERFISTVQHLYKKFTEAPGVPPLNRYGTSSGMQDLNAAGGVPSKNFQFGRVEDVYPVTGHCLVEEGWLKMRVSCYSCPAACHRYCTVEEGEYKGTHTGGPEFETLSAFGTGCMVSDTAAILKASELCNIYGLDVISTGSCVQWLMECNEKGVITSKEADGLDLSWGNTHTMVELVRKIAFREGIGDILAEGLKIASEEVGQDSYKWAVQARGLEQSRVDTRSAFAYALAFSINSRGPDHLNSECLAEFGGNEVFDSVIEKITGDKKYAKPYLTEKRPEIFKWHEEIYAASDSLGICAFPTTAQYWTNEEDLAELYTSATGIEITSEDVMNSGRRTLNLERIFNGMLGHTREEDVLPYRLMNEESVTAVPENKIRVNSKEMLDSMKDKYYELVGWDNKRGLPTIEILEELDMTEVIEKFEKFLK
ncbi:MAG: aldehyde ferredoxin oxidoreductase family protein [Gudongella sp.]|nr:aldehyde ferredoxin oxidoreductase family protein [Gudongella sp.]